MDLIGSDLACVRGQREIFAGLGFRAAGGEALLLVGPNGAGKSSLLRLIAGLVRRTAGTLTLDGGDPELTVPEQAHYLGHQDALKTSLSVTENLAFWIDFLGGDRGRIDAALDAVALAEIADLPAGFLSAGQRRRLSIARLVAVDRPVWLLDEPTAALDVASQARLAGLMKAHLSGGGIVVAATHGPLGLDDTRELRLGGVA
ncbi:heme ABC exporter ATP-binding protein CcmA [Rhodoplanes elegans]|uniref:Heme ABC exporter ATP-binding protein CcmA n=1 Tax=Rhodoplanes elegans TaxID=29408 RepID=A0A327K5T1_9BRAD|nr:heme ABC exporter ATP-binding protein CcmA [Rhodoplanes elegans]MBK5957085.1 heme ABC exporter ATP-binding protein CcmA [Rhodoplanes elegans]RAI33276.1 heme ABC exporter ATP-binding protein CcmA [Rhodoplanes elegans]